MVEDKVKGSLMRLFKGIDGLDFVCSVAENNLVRYNGRDIAIVHDLPCEEFRSASILKRGEIGREDREVYDSVVNRLKERGYGIHRGNHLGSCLRIVT